MSDAVLYEVDEGVATITLNRPERLNAMDVEMMAGFVSSIEQTADDDAVRAVIYTGAGRGFCAGADLKAKGVLGEGGTHSRIGMLNQYQRSVQLLREMPKVTIAAVNGPAAGAGMSWACAADLRYAALSAKFLTAFVNVGLSGDFGMSWTLPRIIGPSRARELYFLNEAIGGEQAAEIGLVSRALPDEELMPYVREIAARVSHSAPAAIAGMKRNLNEGDEIDFTEALKREADRHVRSGAHPDAAEARAAFLEKRAPNFSRG